MSASKRFMKKGFTLVEILIVVVILGILAAIVIPQFSSASETAKGSSLQSQLQTIRSQLELYQVQHNGTYPTLSTNWDQMTTKTDVDGEPGGTLGPYLQQPPINPINGKSAIGEGWYYVEATGEIYPIVASDAEATKFGVQGKYSKEGAAPGEEPAAPVTP